MVKTKLSGKLIPKQDQFTKYEKTCKKKMFEMSEIIFIKN